MFEVTIHLDIQFVLNNSRKMGETDQWQFEEKLITDKKLHVHVVMKLQRDIYQTLIL